MVRIILNATDTYNPYNSGTAKIIRSSYSFSDLFIDYLHLPQIRLNPGNIDVYKKRNGNRLEIRTNREYSKSIVSKADVYYNKYFSSTPLILVIYFDGKVKNRYWKYSELSKPIDENRYRYPDNLPVYLSEYTIINALFEENDRLSDFLTYNLEKKDKTTYNNGKIIVKDDTKSIERLAKYGFTKLKHTPTYGHSTKKSCSIYGRNLLMGRDSSNKPIILEEVQNNVHTSVSTYWSSGNISEPLLLEFHQLSKNNNYEYNYYSYFIFRKDDKGSYFQKLDNSSEELKEYIVSKFFDTYMTLAFGDFQPLIELLKKLESNNVNTVYLLLNNTDTYTKKDVSDALYSLSNVLSGGRHIMSHLQPEVITVQQNLECTSLTNANFKCYEHLITINRSSNIFTSKSREIVFKVLIKNNYYNNYTELRLYNGKGSRYENNRVYISQQYDNNKIFKAYVYFYDVSSKPLLLFFNKAYRPIDLDEYSEYRWSLEAHVASISCTSETSDQDKNVTSLLEVLDAVITILNLKPPEKKKPRDFTKVKTSGSNESHQISLKTNLV
nr:hypothetical protein MACL_00002242 [Theileria orientalis]